MRQKSLLAVTAVIIASISLIAYVQPKQDSQTNKACSRCASPQNKCNKTESVLLDPFNHLIARL